MTEETKQVLPKAKQTKLGLYVTAKEAYEMWKEKPQTVKILDVRMPEEYIFVGHPEMAFNIPLVFQSYDWDSEKKIYSCNPNPDFMKDVKETFQPEDVILVTCRSGGRGAIAVNMLEGAGYKNVYNITDGIEGDLVSDPNSPHKGKRMKDGWKNSDIPWTYDVNPELIKIRSK